MNRRAVLRIASLLILTAASTANADTRRFLLAAGANTGGPDRVALQYAVTDAESFGDIMVRMGGVRVDDRIVLRQPDGKSLEAALAALERRIAALPAAEGRVEVVFYYSGHADDRGLLLGEERLSYAELRARIGAIPAALRITVLDACGSGAITRLKGGERRPAFLIDDSTEMEGYAFLTSSSASEAAQESDAIGASYFTHFLVSGLRGAADVSGEGRISLTEAYQFAFQETLARTTESEAGAQHPSYHINLSGTGDVVMTDIRETSAGLALGEDLRGRFFIRDADDHLIAELYKPAGRRITLGLEAGEYRIHMSREPKLWTARVALARDELLVLRPEHFQVTDRQAAVVRGGQGSWPPRPGFLGPLTGRWRLALAIGKSGTGIEGPATPTAGAVTTHAGTQDLLLGLGLSRWLREDVALGCNLTVLEGDVSTSTGSVVTTNASGIVGLRVGVKRYGPGSMLRTSVRPFLSLDAEAVMASEDRTESGVSGVDVVADRFGAFGLVPGAGADFLLGNRFMVGTMAGYGLLTDFSEPFAGRRNYSGFEASVSLGWLFGRGL